MPFSEAYMCAYTCVCVCVCVHALSSILPHDVETQIIIS